MPHLICCYCYYRIPTWQWARPPTSWRSPSRPAGEVKSGAATETSTVLGTAREGAGRLAAPALTGSKPAAAGNKLPPLRYRWHTFRMSFFDCFFYSVFLLHLIGRFMQWTPVRGTVTNKTYFFSFSSLFRTNWHSVCVTSFMSKHQKY